jgi:nickel/cobalt transporter (NicO) family protein
MVPAHMIRRIFALAFALLTGLLIASGPARAHPHVWVTMTTQIVYAPDGTAIAVKHAWTFDDMYSTFATQDLKSKEKGKFTREELAPLAEVNATSLKEFNYFTFATANGEKLALNDASDYWLEFKDSMLTLFFTLTFKSPVRADRIDIEIFDPDFFVDFSFPEKNPAPVTLTGAPEKCKVHVIRPTDASQPQVQRLPDAQATPGQNLGAQFASSIIVNCSDVPLVMAENTQAQPAAPARTQNAPPTSSSSGGIVGWIISKQAEFNLKMRTALRDAKTDGSAVWGLLWVALLYGVFHAAGPGHGKAVISSYLVANNETWRRGIVLSFASAFLQAIVAVAVVGFAVAVFQASTRAMCDAERVIEIVSYGLIALIGARLVWVKGRGFLGAMQSVGRPLQAVGAAVTPPHQHGHAHHDHKHHDHKHHDHKHHDHDHHHHDHNHDHHHRHEHASAWGHAHGPEPEELAGPGGWKRGFSAIVAVGLRPCSGAIIILVFAMAQGLFWAGVASTFVMALGTAITVAAIATIAVSAKSFAGKLSHSRSGYGMLVMRGIEVAAAFVVLAFGTLLMLGYLLAERLPATICG